MSYQKISKGFHENINIFLCITALLLSGCGTMDMRKISVEPKISTENIRKSSLKAGLILKEHFTDYKYNFETGKQLYLLAKVRGEIDIGKNLSNALYGIVSSKFKSVSMGRNINEIDDVDIYFVPRIKSFEFLPPTRVWALIRPRLNSKRKFSTEMASCSTESASSRMEAEACLINLH